MTLIEYFDKDAIKNILAVLTLKPERVVYIYDSAIGEDKYFRALDKCFKKHLPQICVEAVSADINSVSDIYEKTLKIIDEYDNCAMELTGGSELMLIAGYKAGSERNIKMFYTDIAREEIRDIDGCGEVIKTAKLSLDDFIDARCAKFVGESHNEPDEKLHDNIMAMCRYIFRNLQGWSHTCGYMQAANSAGIGGTKFSCNIPFIHKDGRHYRPDKDTMEMFEKNGFIKNLLVSSNKISFSYCFPEAKTYLCSYGLWLEMFVFISAKRTGKFSDVKLGTMIDWDAYDNFDAAGNEIDVILMENSIPVFISCKLRGISTPDINELYIERKRLGGWFSKGVIVTSGFDKIKNTGTFKKAQEFGIIVMDRADIKSRDFGEKLFDEVSGQDIVAMKWSKV